MLLFVNFPTRIRSTSKLGDHGRISSAPADVPLNHLYVVIPDLVLMQSQNMHGGSKVPVVIATLDVSTMAFEIT